MLDIENIMTANPHSLGPEATLEEARILMQEDHIRHLPIVDDSGHLVGLVSQRDLLAATISSLNANPDQVHDYESHVTVASFMRTDIETATLSSDIRRLAVRMQERKIGCIPVLDGERLAGIVTDSDYVGLAINLLEQLEEVEPDEIEFDEEDPESLDLLRQKHL